MKRSKGEPPKVTGLSPKEGPPGTKLTIRGENLGLNAKDIVGLIICQVNCTLLAEWISPSKIICRTTTCKGLGDVIVATRSGGIGSCTVKFRGTAVTINPILESAIWVDESSFFERPLNKNMSQPTSPMQGSTHDPLGLAETSPPMSDEELQAMFPGCSSNLAHKNFEPLLYLIENHSATSFQDLKKGLIYLEKNSTLKAEGPQTFIKSNLGTFMNCQDILAAIHESLQMHENLGNDGNPFVNSKPNGEGDGLEGEDVEEKRQEFTLEKIEDCLTKCNENAQAIFRSVLHRKDRADSTRNALNVLNRFKFLFHLPVNIERNIKRADYEVVINDYGRARQLFDETEVPVFKKVYQEVENMIDDLRIQLEKKLMELPLALEDQKKLIRYLVELEADGDPAWKCIDNQQQWLLTLLLKCKKEHLQIDQKYNQPDSMGTSLRPHKGHTRTHSGSQFKLITPDTAGVDMSPPQRVLYLEELVDILQLTFTDMWKLGQSYFSASIVAEAGGKDMDVDGTKRGIFEERITDVTRLFANLIRAAFLPTTLKKLPEEKRLECGEWSDFQSESPGAWLPQCVRNTRSILSSFTSLDVPTSALKHIKSLVTDLRIQCLTVLFKEATEDIRSLYGRETWGLQMDDHGGITTLPLLFESIVIDTLQHLKEVVTFTKSQEQENIFTDFEVTRQSVELASDMLKAFAQCLDQLAFQPKAEADTTQRLQLTEAVQRAPESIFQKGEDSLPSMEQCLVIVLSNCSHVSEHITPNLIEQFKSHGYPKMLEVENNVLDAYAELDEKIFEAYCEQKTDPLVGALEPGMYEGHFDWGDCPKPTGVRAYVKEGIMIAIAIHAEVHAIAPAFMPRVMAQVLEAIADEMGRLMSCVTNFSANGALQARLELAAMEEALNPYRNAGSSTSFQEAVQLVPALSASDKGLLQDLLTKFHSDMRFQLLCFTVDQSVH